MARLGRARAPSSPSPSCFGSWTCLPAQEALNIFRREVLGVGSCPTPRGWGEGLEQQPLDPDSSGASGAAPWQRFCSHALGTVHLHVGQAGSQAVGTAGREV